MIGTDENGNAVASVLGGLHDGDQFFCRDFVEGDTFVPGRMTQNRPMYRFTKGSFVFVGFDPDPDCLGK